MGDAGIKTKDYGKVLDMLTVAHQKSGIQVDKLAESLAKYGAPMRQLGFDTKSSIAIFSGWKKAGVNTSIAFSGMKKAISNWGSEGKKPMEEFPKAMQKIKDSTNPTADAIKIFGAKAGPDLADAIKSGRFNYEEYAKALTKSNGALQKSAAQTSTPFKDFQKIMHSFQTSLAQTGRVMIQAVAPSMQKLLVKVQGLATWFSKLSPQTKTNAIAIAAIAAAIGPVLVGISKAIKAVQTIHKAFQTITVAMKSWNLITKTATIVQTAFNAVMSANPIGLIVIAIATVVAAITLFLTKTKTGQAIVKATVKGIQGAWKGLSDFLKPIFSAIGKAASGIWNGVITAVKAMGQVIKSVWNLMGKAIKVYMQVILAAIRIGLTGILGFWKLEWNVLSTIVKVVWKGLETVVKVSLNVIKTVISTVINAIKIVWNTSWNVIKTVVSTVWNAIKTIVSVSINAISSIIKTTWNAIKSVTSTVWNTIKSVISTVWKAIKVVVTGGINGVKKVVSFVWNTIKKITSTIWNDIKIVISTVWKVIKAIVGSTVNWMKNHISSVWHAIKSVTTTIWNGIKFAIVNPIIWAKNKISGIVEAIKSFFKNMKLSIPKIHLPPMPHFSIKGGFSLNPPKAPSIGVKWYAQGAIFKKPTLFNGPTGLSGAGEAGPEAMLPLDKQHLSEIGNAISQNMKGGNNFTFNVNVTGNGNNQELANQIADKLEREFRQKFNNQSMAFGGGSIA